MSRGRTPYAQVGIYALVMILILGGLILVFSDYRSGSTVAYRAVFADASGLKSGQNVRVAGVPVGKVSEVSLQPDASVLVAFSVDSSRPLTVGSHVAIKYENLIGDRYVDVTQGPADQDDRRLASDATIPVRNTTPALDIDSLIGGFKPLFRTVGPDDINKLTGSLVGVLQGQGQTLRSLLDNVAQVTDTLADQDEVIGRTVDNLNTVLGTVDRHKNQVDDSVAALQLLVSQLTNQPDSIGGIIDRLERATLTVGSVTQDIRPDLQSTVVQLHRVSTQLDDGRDELGHVISSLPAAYRRLARMGSYGSLFQLYACQGILRLSDPKGQNIDIPLVSQTTGRCAP